jgi:hypothetical protein
MNHDILQRLKAPFPFDEVEAKIQVTTNDKTKGMAVFYTNSRAIQNRLDEVLGPFGWKNQYISWHERAQLCGIAVLCAERNEWIGKYDGAECSDVEPIKGGLSDSFKRAACMWGIGRYLYLIDGVWVSLEQKGKNHIIKKDQYALLKAEYNAAINKIFGTADESGSLVEPSPHTSSSRTPQAINTKKPTPLEQAPSSEATSSLATPFNGKTQTQAGDGYIVKSTKPSGASSTLLELIAADGKSLTAYIKTSDIPIKSGAHLHKVEMVTKSSSHGPYNLINNYQLAA